MHFKSAHLVYTYFEVQNLNHYHTSFVLEIWPISAHQGYNSGSVIEAKGKSTLSAALQVPFQTWEYSVRIDMPLHIL